MESEPLTALIEADGLRLVSVRGVPSPWSQAAKAMIEHKGLAFRMALMEPLGANPELLAWAGTNSAPVLAWRSEPPINRWNDILILLERLAPERPLLPETPRLRAEAFGLAHEICGEGGLGWNRRLCQIQPAIESGLAPPELVAFGLKYGYAHATSVAAARQRSIACLKMLDEQLGAQDARGSRWFVGDAISAVDFYWAAFSLLFKSRPLADVPVAEPFRPLFLAHDEDLLAALSPRLEAHRDAMLERHFGLPMEF